MMSNFTMELIVLTLAGCAVPWLAIRKDSRRSPWAYFRWFLVVCLAFFLLLLLRAFLRFGAEEFAKPEVSGAILLTGIALSVLSVLLVLVSTLIVRFILNRSRARIAER
jgi:prolipoprotein diacylglyceryltransferase